MFRQQSQSAGFLRNGRLSRRCMLRGSGVALPLPFLNCMTAAAAGSEADAANRRRMVAINFELSFHPPNLMPEVSGADYPLTPYLLSLESLRRDFTIISGTSHPDVDGGHAASKSWLTGAAHPGASNFVNTISMDQLAANAIGLETRWASLVLGSGGISVSANGVPVPAMPFAARLFQTLFVEGDANEQKRQIQRLQEGRSVLDSVTDGVRRMQARVGTEDRGKLEQYFTAIRDAEQRLKKAEQWQHKPKPHVDAEPMVELRDLNDITGRAKQFYDIMYLALLTDSTRVMTFCVGDSNAVASLPGVTMNYHDLSHHGQDPEKLKQLAIIESAHLNLFGEFLTKLKSADEGGVSLLSQTMVLLGSHMHSGGHDNRNLPVILAGGNFRHGQHLAFDRTSNTPMAQLYVSMLQQMGLAAERFSSGSCTLPGLEAKS
ncbi:MAG: DUF1552 domain-containing protein [Planctomyces sp.]